MADRTVADRARTDARRAWVIGGALLIASAVFTLVIPPGTLPIPGIFYVPTVLTSASVLIFAFGIRGSGSVVRRRPLGMTALIVLAVWPVPYSIAEALWLQHFLTTGEEAMSIGMAISYVDLGVRFVAAVIAVSQIARSGVVPRPWNGAPAWALAATVAVQVVSQIIAVSAGANSSLLTLMMTIGNLVNFGAPIFLGVLAIILANLSGRTRTTPIYVAGG